MEKLEYQLADLKVGEFIRFKPTCGFVYGEVKQITNKALLVECSEWKRDGTGRAALDENGKVIVITKTIAVPPNKFLQVDPQLDGPDEYN